jgi:tetratricopeptide (TPR) repeat protein
VSLGLAVLGCQIAAAQVMPGGRPGMGGAGASTRPGGIDDEPPHAAEPKPDKEAAKALAAGVKSLEKAKELEASIAAAGSNAEKRAKLLEKLSDTYNKALDQFTEALVNNSELFEAWNDVGYVHLKLGAYREAVDDYDHALKLKPDSLAAEEHRAEAYLAIDRLEDAKVAYMDLYNHAPPLAEQLMAAMQQWSKEHRTEARGMRPQDIESFDHWVLERDRIAREASLPHAAASNP